MKYCDDCKWCSCNFEPNKEEKRNIACQKEESLLMNTDYFKYRIWDEEDKKYVSELVFINHCGEICLIENGALYRHKCTIERCTGIKDMYQNLIYQNDIVRTNTPCDGEPELKVIRWKDCYAGYLLTACDFPSGYCDFYGGLTFDQETASEYVSVIGNIHDEEK